MKQIRRSGCTDPNCNKCRDPFETGNIIPPAICDRINRIESVDPAERGCNCPRCSNLPINECNERCDNNNGITDSYLLWYLLKKYNLDKQKLIASIVKWRQNDERAQIMYDFYKYNTHITLKPFRDQYRFFKNWNNTGIDIYKEELEDYFENNVKPYV